MSFSFTPQQPQQSLFQSPFQPQQQQSPFQSPFQQQQPSPFQPQQQQQSSFQLQPQPQQQQPPAQSQPHLYLFTNEKVPAAYSTKWAELHPDSQKALLQIEERILEYRGESQLLDQCSRLYNSSSNNGFELDASYIVKEHGGIIKATERQKATLKELMTVAKEMLRNTEIAVQSFMMLRPRFLHQNKVAASDPTALSQTLGATGTQTSVSQAPTNSVVPIYDFYSGLPNKPSPFLQQTVARFDKYLFECRQWIEELEQLVHSESEKSSLNTRSSLLQSLPKVLTNVHAFFVHVAAKVESIHQHIESMKTAYLADQRRRGEESNPFLEADRRETARQEAAARRVHPTLHLPSASQPTNQAQAQAPGPLPIAAPPAASTTPNTGSGTPLFSTTAAAPAASTPFSTPTPSNLFSTPTPSNLFSTPTASTPPPSLFGTAATPQPSPFGSNPLFGSTPASTPFGTGAVAGSGASFGTASKSRAKSRTGRR